jgi:anti-sigma-K factor RskA
MMQSTTDDDRPELDAPILQGLGQAVPQVEPSPDLRARVLASARARTRATTPPSRPAFLPWLAVAASLALVVGLTLYAAQLRARIGVLEAELRDARERADRTERLMADAQRTAQDAQASVAVLTAPDVARVDLAGQPVAPQASARAFWSRSRGMVFTASNLPPLPAGRTYQLWVVTGEGPTSAGLLTPDAAGNVNETFNTSPTIPPPVAIAVTIEPAGGVPAPTGERFLVGTV